METSSSLSAYKTESSKSEFSILSSDDDLLSTPSCSPPGSPTLEIPEFLDLDFLHPISEGTSGAWLVRSKDDSPKMYVFKPSDKEPFLSEDASGKRSPLKKGVEWGRMHLKERAAFILDDGFAGVPYTQTVFASKHSYPSLGSLQEYRNNVGTCEDIGTSILAEDDVHRIGILDIRLLNLDRHMGNILVTDKFRLVPIDHGYIIPSVHELSDITFEWLYWKQCKVPFSREIIQKVMSINPVDDACVLRQLGLRNEEILCQFVATIFLKFAVEKGKNLWEIGKLVQRNDVNSPSKFEGIVKCVLQELPFILSESPEPFALSILDLVVKACRY